MRFETFGRREVRPHVEPGSQQARLIHKLEQTKEDSVPLGAQFDALAAREREPLQTDAPVPSTRKVAVVAGLALVLTFVPVPVATPMAASLLVLFLEWSLIFGLGTTPLRHWVWIAGIGAAALGVLGILGELGTPEIAVAFGGAFIIAVTCGGWWQGLLRQREVREAEAREAFLRRN